MDGMWKAVENERTNQFSAGTVVFHRFSTSRLWKENCNIYKRLDCFHTFQQALFLTTISYSNVFLVSSRKCETGSRRYN